MFEATKYVIHTDEPNAYKERSILIAKLFFSSQYGMSPLHFAAQSTNVKVIKALLSAMDDETKNKVFKTQNTYVRIHRTLMLAQKLMEHYYQRFCKLIGHSSSSNVLKCLNVHSKNVLHA
jgi:hypothetical protein